MVLFYDVFKIVGAAAINVHLSVIHLLLSLPRGQV